MPAELNALVTQLQTFGLTDSQARAYLAVVKSGPCTAVEVARKARVQRSDVYVLMSKLAAMGLVEETLDKPKRYRPSNPRVALSRLAEQTTSQLKTVISLADKLGNQLASLRSDTFLRAEPEVRVITGYSNAEANFLELLASVQREVWIIAGRKEIAKIKGHVIARFLDTVSQKHLAARLITELDERLIRRLGKRIGLVEIRHSEGLPSYVYGFDDRAVGVGLTGPEVGDQVSVILVTHPKTVRIVRDSFEHFWEYATPFNAWAAMKEQEREMQRQRTIIWGREQLYASLADWQLKAKERVLHYMPTENGPLRVSRHLGDGHMEARKRGVRIQSLCHISSANVAAVREMMRFSDVRHTEASPGVTFSVLDESEAVIHYVHIDTPEITCPTDISIHITDREATRRLAEWFELLWNNSTSAETKIRELPAGKNEPAESAASQVD